MRRLLVAALTATLVLAAILAARTETTSAAAATTLTVAIPGSFAGCDPSSTSTTDATDAVLGLVLPSAFTVGPLTTPVGDTFVVAQAEVVRLSPQTVVYTIAPGVTWPGGRAFSAADLVRTWQERRGDAVLADLGYRAIASMHSNAAGTQVTVVFRAAYSDWESLFNLVVPHGTHGAACRLPSDAMDPSIGPYRIASATSTSIRLVANPLWTGAAPAYSRVLITTDPAAPATGATRAAFLPNPTVAQLQALTATGSYTSRIQHSTAIVSVDFAVRGPDALAPSVRGALARFVDRAAILSRYVTPVDYTVAPEVSHLLGQGEAGYTGAPGVPVAQATPPPAPVPGASGPDAYGATADPSVADAMLRSDGYAKTADGWLTPQHEPFVVCLAAPSADPSLAPIATSVATQLAAQGVRVASRRVPTDQAAAELLRAGGCTAAVDVRTGDGFITHRAASWLAPDVPIPADLQWTGVDDPVAEADAAQATAVLNPVEAQPAWNAMDARLWDLMASLPLYSPSAYEAWSSTIAGVVPCTSAAAFIAQIPTLLPASTKP